MRVDVKGDTKEDCERALKHFTKLVKKSEVLNELKRREYYVKRSKKKILKRQEALRRRIRDEKKVQKRKETDW